MSILDTIRPSTRRSRHSCPSASQNSATPLRRSELRHPLVPQCDCADHGDALEHVSQTSSRLTVSCNTLVHRVCKRTVTNTERSKSRWMPKHRQHLLMRLIDGEREIHPEVLRRPARRLPLGREVQYRNLVGIGNIHENPRTHSFQLEALGMSLQWNVGDFLAAQRVNH